MSFSNMAKVSENCLPGAKHLVNEFEETFAIFEKDMSDYPIFNPGFVTAFCVIHMIQTWYTV